jgi:hypothetical protein
MYSQFVHDLSSLQKRFIDYSVLGVALPLTIVNGGCAAAKLVMVWSFP